MRFVRTNASVGAIVEDVDLRSFDADQWNTLYAAFLEHALLIFPGQHLSPADQIAFAQRLGPLEAVENEIDLTYYDLSNSDGDSIITDASDPRLLVHLGNQEWHTDSSFRPVAAKASLLAAITVPSAGGETEWADMRAAYDALPAPKKKAIVGLSAFHSYARSQQKVGATVTNKGYLRKTPPQRALINVHPETTRPSLFIGRHAYGIPGMDERSSELLLQDLVEFACQPPRIVTHRWQPGDIALWDNRCLLHRGRPWDYRELRVMKHSRVAGNPLTEAGLNGET
jgi:alpha-ketoglutarate-dependent taurine dioxygenase